MEGRIDPWQPRRKPRRRKRNTNSSPLGKNKRGREKRPLSFCGEPSSVGRAPHSPVTCRQAFPRRFALPDSRVLSSRSTNRRFSVAGQRLRYGQKLQWKPVGREICGGNLLRDIFDGKPRLFQLRSAAAGNQGCVFLQVVEDECIHVVSPLGAGSQGIDRKLQALSASSCDLGLPVL